VRQVKIPPGVDFTNLCAPSENSSAHSVWQKFCHSIHQHNYTTFMGLKFANFVRHLPNAIHHKKLSTYVGEIDPCCANLHLNQIVIQMLILSQTID